MEHSTMMSLSHQKLNDLAEVARCLGSSQTRSGTCSQCKIMEAAFGDFSIKDFHTEIAKRWSSFPNLASMGYGHRCKQFPCPVCNPGRSQRDDDESSSAAVVTPKMLEWCAHGAVQQMLQHGGRQQTGEIFFGDGGHVCRSLPCPICGNGKGRSAALGVEVGC